MCPCGKSYYTVKKYSDSKGPFEEMWEMKCGCCKNKYEVSSLFSEKKNEIIETKVWMPVKMFNDIISLESHLYASQKKTIEIAHEMFMEKWILYCFSGKNKKEIWKLLTDEGKREPEFSFFDKKVTAENIIDYLKEYFNYQNLDYILKKLKANDLKINQMRSHTEEIRNKLNATEKIIQMKGFAN
jgi:hypothetical protein